MRGAKTPAGWGRSQLVLAACAGVAAPSVVLFANLGLRWAAVASGVLAVVAGLAVVGIAVARTRVEGRQERYQLGRRLRVPVAPIMQVDPMSIGVDPAGLEQRVLPGDALPRYVDRGVDSRLRSAIAAGLRGEGKWLVVVEGMSKVGKSRTLFEALLGQPGAERLQLVAPMDAASLRSMLDPGQMVVAKGPAVLWLDDLEPFLADGVTLKELREWRSGSSGRIVAATFGGKGSAQVSDMTDPDLITRAANMLAHAERIQLQPTSAEEIAALRNLLSDVEFDAVQRYGLAAFLIAASELDLKLKSAQHAPGGPAGAAVLLAAINWARCGRTDPLGDTDLRQLWPTHLPLWPHRLSAHVLPDDASFQAGLTWALRPVSGTIALLHRTDGYQAYDYVVQQVRDDPAHAPPPDAVWTIAIDSASAEQAGAVGEMAYAYSRLSDSATALTRARESSTGALAANAGYHLGVVHKELGQVDQALAAYQQVIDDYADDPDPELRETVAMALYNCGVTLGDQRQVGAELAAYQRVIDDYADDPSPVTRWQVAKALGNLGFVLEEQGRVEEALAAHQRVIDDYADDPSPMLREQVARALGNLGAVLEEQRRVEEALAAWQRVIDHYADDPEPELRRRVGMALYNLVITLGKRGQVNEALAALQRLIYDPDPATRQHVASALYGLGITLKGRGQVNEALAALQLVIDDYAGDPDPATRQCVASALYDRGVMLGEREQVDAELASYQRVIDDYADDPSPMTRWQVVQALGNLGFVLEEQGRVEDALAAHQRVIDDYADDPSPVMREAVARAICRLNGLIDPRP